MKERDPPSGSGDRGAGGPSPATPHLEPARCSAIDLKRSQEPIRSLKVDDGKAVQSGHFWARQAVSNEEAISTSSSITDVKKKIHN